MPNNIPAMEDGLGDLSLLVWMENKELPDLHFLQLTWPSLWIGSPRHTKCRPPYHVSRQKTVEYSPTRLSTPSTDDRDHVLLLTMLDEELQCKESILCPLLKMKGPLFTYLKPAQPGQSQANRSVSPTRAGKRRPI